MILAKDKSKQNQREHRDSTFGASKDAQAHGFREACLHQLGRLYMEQQKMREAEPLFIEAKLVIH